MSIKLRQTTKDTLLRAFEKQQKPPGTKYFLVLICTDIKTKATPIMTTLSGAEQSALAKNPVFDDTAN